MNAIVLPEQAHGHHYPAWSTPRDTLELAPQAMQLAQWFAPTEFVPLELRNRPEATLACMLTGYELGLPLMVSLRMMAIIKGRPALYAEAMRVLVLSKGHEIWAQEWTETRCLLMGRRRGEERVHPSLWTMDDAQRAGLAGLPTWRAYPKPMLLARATTQLCRLAFPDVIGGLPYSVEEIRDPDWREEETPADRTPPKPGAGAAKEPRRTTRRRARRPADPEGGAGPVPAPARAAGAGDPPRPPEQPAAEGTEPGGQVNTHIEQVGAPDARDTGPSPQPPEPPMPEPPAVQEERRERAWEEHLTLAQQIAMVCREAHIERAQLIQALTGKDRARDVTREEALRILTAAREIAAGRQRLVEEGGLWTVLDVVEEPEFYMEPTEEEQ